MGLEEMEAYAKQALKIDSLERTIKGLYTELEATKVDTLPKDKVRKWLTIGKDYLFVEDDYKEEIRIIFGEV